MSRVEQSSDPLTPQLAELGLEHWQAFLQRVDEYQPDAKDKLAARQEDVIRGFALSDFIRKQSCAHPDWLLAIAFKQPPAVELTLSQALEMDEATLFKQLRLLRHSQMLHIAWRDLVEEQSILDSLAQVSELTDQLICLAYHWSYAQLERRFGAPHGARDKMPLLILGMGKLGGNELNFSSDIDLIFTYPQQGELHYGRKSIEYQQFFTKLGQKVIAALDQITAEGRVHRVDMRLRPLGDSGPLVIHFDALEDYYQEQGREWERYALVKARVLNPEPEYTHQLQDILRPFVYRRYLDFSAIESLREMKLKIAQEYRRRALSDNIKLGKGGIREVEFVAQCFQLIHGGKQPQLRVTSLIETLNELGSMDLLTKQSVEQLETGYLFLRRAEHCLQQFNDEQTQTLPHDDLGRSRLALAMGFADFIGFLQALEAHQGYIHAVFQDFIGEDEEADVTIDDTYLDLWSQDLGAEDSASLLAKVLPSDTAVELSKVFVDFRSHATSKVRGERGTRVLDKLMPQLLQQLLSSPGSTEQSAPTTARVGAAEVFARVTWVLNAVLGRTAYLELLQTNIGALQQLIRLCGHSRWIAQQLSHFPLLLDDLLNPVTLYQPTPFADYSRELQLSLLRVPEEDVEQQWTVMRQFKLSQQLHIAAADVSGALPVMHVSDHLTFLAEALLKAAVGMAKQQLSERFGHLPCEEDESSFGVIAYGKLGGIELGYGSDLDLVFVYDGDRQQPTTGPKQVDAAQYYLKLAQRTLHILTTKTALGALYEVDMRLRPSGNAGLLVCHVDAYETYLREEAWTWEYQALVRARMVSGSSALQRHFRQLRKSLLAKPRDVAALRSKVADMRERMRQHKLDPGVGDFDIKQSPGGMTDVEFLIQFWVLAHAQENPDLDKWSDNVRQLNALVVCDFIDTETCQRLTEAYLALREFYHHQMLQEASGTVEQEALSETLKGQRDAVMDIWRQVF